MTERKYSVAEIEALRTEKSYIVYALSPNNKKKTHEVLSLENDILKSRDTFESKGQAETWCDKLDKQGYKRLSKSR